MDGGDSRCSIVDSLNGQRRDKQPHEDGRAKPREPAVMPHMLCDAQAQTLGNEKEPRTPLSPRRATKRVEAQVGKSRLEHPFAEIARQEARQRADELLVSLHSQGRFGGHR